MIFVTPENELSRYTENRNEKLYYSPKGKIKFKEIQLPTKLIQVCPAGDVLYIGNSTKLYRYEDGKLTDMNMPTGA